MNDEIKQNSDETGDAAIENLQNKYIEIQRGILAISAKLEGIRNTEPCNDLINEVNEISKRVQETTTRLDTIPILHRKVGANNALVKAIQVGLHDLEALLKASEGDVIRLETRYEASHTLILALQHDASKLTDSLNGMLLAHSHCTTKVQAFITELVKWRDEEVTPAIKRIDRLWWSLVAINAMIGIAVVVIPLFKFLHDMFDGTP